MNRYIWYSPLRDFRSSYRKLALVGFELATTGFCSDALTDSDIRPWVQLPLSANFVQLLQFQLFVQCLHFISTIAFLSRHICFKRNLAQVIMLVAESIDTYGIQHRRILEVAIESRPEWDLNPQPLNSPLRRSNWLRYQAMSSTRTQNQLCTAFPNSFLFALFTFLFGHWLHQSPHLL